MWTKCKLAVILLIDNYDSFTYNLVQYLGEVGQSLNSISVYRNDELSIEEVYQLKPQRIILSPGPCTPNEAGISVELVQEFYKQIPILGVCLGHQAIAQAFGSEIVRSREPIHGKSSTVYHNNKSIFVDLPPSFKAGRYHSLIVKPNSLAECLSVTAWTENNDTSFDEIMAIEHKDYPSLVGLQFHPESILTAQGRTLLRKFLQL